MEQWEQVWQDYYEILQVRFGAPLPVIRGAYRGLATIYHPDSKETGDPALFKLLNEAQEVLCDRERRVRYDAAYRERMEPTETMASAPFLLLRGRFVAPDLLQQEIERRLGFGYVLDLPFSDGQTALVITEGATTLLNLRQRTVLWEIDCPANSGALSRDGAFLALGRREQIYIWDLRTGRLGRELAGHSGVVTSLAVSPDGRVLASGGADQVVKLWDMADGRELRRMEGHLGAAEKIAFSPDGRLLVSADGYYVLPLWDVATGHELHRYEDADFALSPNGRLLATARSLGRELCQISVWDLTTGRLLNRAEHNFNIYRLVFSPDSRLLAVGSGTLRLLDGTTACELFNLSGHPLAIFGIVFSPDGKLLTSAGREGTLRLWETSSGREVSGMPMTRSMIAGYTVAFGRDSRQVSVGNFIGEIRRWDVTSGRELPSLLGHQGSVHTIAFGPDGRLLASGGADGTLRIWDLIGGRELRRSNDEHGGDVYATAISPGGDILASSGSDQRVVLRNLAGGRRLREFEGHHDAVNRLSFSPDGRLLASGSFDKTMRLWDVSTGRELRRWEHDALLTAVVFSPSGQQLFSGDQDGNARLWDVASGRELRRYEKSDGFLCCLAVNPTGELLAVGGSFDAAVRLLEISSGRERRRFKGHNGAVNEVTFSPDGRLFVSSANDRTVRVWRAMI